MVLGRPLPCGALPECGRGRPVEVFPAGPDPITETEGDQVASAAIAVEHRDPAGACRTIPGFTGDGQGANTVGEQSWRLVAILGAVVALSSVIPAVTPIPAMAEDGSDLVAACEPFQAVPEAGPRGCKSLESGTWLTAQGCRRVDALQEPVCPTIDGRPVHAQAVDRFESTWLHRALALQRQLDLDVPLGEALLPHTHNSANSSAYDASVSTLDANQVLTLTDQLRLGIRAIEIDVHWTPQATGGHAVVQCHGEPVDTPAGTLHAGCSVDTPLADLLAEVKRWLDQEANADEVLLLYLENALDAEPAAHAAAVDAIATTLGPLVARPAAGAGCQSLPVAGSKRDLLDDGTRVLITGNCGPGGWNDWVYDRYPSWDESGGSAFDCNTERAAIDDFDPILVRRYEDSTWLSAMAGSGSHLEADTIASLVRCGVNLVGFDQLHPGDDRLPGLVWSWRTGEPAVDATDRCAALDDEGRFFADACTTARPVACRTASGTWAVATDPVAWAEADVACQAAGHAGAGVPSDGWDDSRLRLAADAAGAAEVWLAYAQDATGAWVTGTPAVARETDPRSPGHAAGPLFDSAGGPPSEPPGQDARGGGQSVAATHPLPPLPAAGIAVAIAIALCSRAPARRRLR